jgi:hypothetical protein
MENLFNRFDDLNILDLYSAWLIERSSSVDEGRTLRTLVTLANKGQPVVSVQCNIRWFVINVTKGTLEIKLQCEGVRVEAMPGHCVINGDVQTFRFVVPRYLHAKRPL